LRSSSITFQTAGLKISFDFEDLLKYHGPHYPGGAAYAFKVMELAFPLLDGSQMLKRY